MLNREKMKNKMREKLNKKEEEKNLSDNKSTVIDEDKMKNNLFDLLKDESKDLKDLNNNLSLLMEQFTNTNINKPRNKNRRKKSKK